MLFSLNKCRMILVWVFETEYIFSANRRIGFAETLKVNVLPLSYLKSILINFKIFNTRIQQLSGALGLRNFIAQTMNSDFLNFPCIQQIFNRRTKVQQYIFIGTLVLSELWQNGALMAVWIVQASCRRPADLNSLLRHFRKLFPIFPFCGFLWSIALSEQSIARTVQTIPSSCGFFSFFLQKYSWSDLTLLLTRLECDINSYRSPNYHYYKYCKMRINDQN